MRKVLRSGALALAGLTAGVAPLMAATAPPASAATSSHAATHAAAATPAAGGHIVPGHNAVAGPIADFLAGRKGPDDE